MGTEGRGGGEAGVEGEAGGVEVFALVADGAGTIAAPARIRRVGEVARVGAGSADGDVDDGVGRVFGDVQGADAALGVVGAASGAVG